MHARTCRCSPERFGSRPIGTPANARARQYVIDQLRLFGYDVRVQELDARRPEVGYTARVSNIIAVKAGPDRNAIALISHYDSAPEAPGGSDDGLGVAVSLEAARVLAARTDRKHTLFVLVTDGEESGLMGAAGLVTDRDVMDRLNAYVNIDSTGSAGPARALRNRARQRVARQAVGPIGAASARRFVRIRNLPAPAERYRLLDLQTARRAGPELRGDRRQLCVPHRA